MYGLRRSVSSRAADLMTHADASHVLTSVIAGQRANSLGAWRTAVWLALPDELMSILSVAPDPTTECGDTVRARGSLDHDLRCGCRVDSSERPREVRSVDVAVVLVTDPDDFARFDREDVVTCGQRGAWHPTGNSSVKWVVLL